MQLRFRRRAGQRRRRLWVLLSVIIDMINMFTSTTTTPSTTIVVVVAVVVVVAAVVVVVVVFVTSWRFTVYCYVMDCLYTILSFIAYFIVFVYVFVLLLLLFCAGDALRCGRSAIISLQTQAQTRRRKHMSYDRLNVLCAHPICARRICTPKSPEFVARQESTWTPRIPRFLPCELGLCFPLHTVEVNPKVHGANWNIV